MEYKLLGTEQRFYLHTLDINMSTADPTFVSTVSQIKHASIAIFAFLLILPTCRAQTTIANIDNDQITNPPSDTYNDYRMWSWEVDQGIGGCANNICHATGKYLQRQVLFRGLGGPYVCPAIASNRQHLSILSAAVGILLLCSGCGSAGNSTASSTNPVPTASTSNPPSSPSSPPTNPAPAVDNYHATVVAVWARDQASPDPYNASAYGTIAVDTNANDGRGTLQITGGAATSNYELRFCFRGASSPTANCFTVVTFTTDASGSANVNFQIAAGASQNGQFTGAFYIFKDNIATFAGGVDTLASGESFRAVLLPSPPSSFTGSGTVSVSGTTAHITITGGPANQNFQAIACGLSAGCAHDVFFQTDAQGNGAADMQFQSGAVGGALNATFIGDFIVEENNSGVVYAGGAYDSAFRVQ